MYNVKGCNKTLRTVFRTVLPSSDAVVLDTSTDDGKASKKRKV